MIVSQRQSEQTSQTASAPQYTKEDSYSSVNDDEPGFRNILRKAGLSDQSFFAVILTLGGLIGALMMSVAIFGLSFYSDSNIYPSVFTNVIALVVPFTTLIMLVFFTTRLAKLTTLISYAQKTESRLDKTVEIVSLSRVLEQEANQIEARIAKFLSASQTLKHELRSEQNEIETSFVATFSQFKNILGQLEAERRSFFEEINTISQALQMSRDFVSTRIGTLTSDFESAALSAARTLETSISQIATNINTVISKDFAQRSLLEKLIETNEASINSIQEIPEKLSIHIQNALANIHLDLEKNIDRLIAQTDTLSDSIARSNNDLDKSLSDAPRQVAHYATALHQELHQLLTMHAEHFSKELVTITDRINQLFENIRTTTAELPREVEAGLEMLEPNLLMTFRDKTNFASQQLSDIIRPLLEQSTLINKTLESTPAALNQYLEGLGPIINERFAENSQRIETQISIAHEKQLAAGKELVDHAKREFESVLQNIPNFELQFTNTIQANIRNLESQISGAHENIATLFNAHKSTVDFSNRTYAEEMEKNALSQLKNVNEMIDKAWESLQQTLSNSFSQQELRSKDFETSFRELIADFKDAKNDISGVSFEISGVVQNQMKSLENSLEILINRFNSAVSSNQDLAIKNISGQLTTTQQNLSQEYGLIEGRLFRSLNNFNEVVKNCIASLEEAANYRVKAFEDKIRSTSDENLELAQREFEELAARMRMRIEELKGEDLTLQSWTPNERHRSAETSMGVPFDTQDETIAELSRKLERIDSIILELKRSPR